MARPSRPSVIALAGVIAVLAGSWLSVQTSVGSSGPRRYADYLPTEPSTVAGLQGWGVALAVVGAMLITAVLGYWLARRPAGRVAGPSYVSPTTVAVLGAVLVIAGVVTWLLVPEQPASFGWFAYAPLSDQTFTPPIIRMHSTGQNAGLALAALGAVIVSGTAGYRIGHRGIGPQSPESPDGSSGPDRPLPPAGEPA